MLQRDIAKSHSVSLASVRLSVSHTRDLYLNGSRYRNTFLPFDRV